MTDPRARAFLREMGITPLWTVRGAEPEPAAAAPHEPAQRDAPGTVASLDTPPVSQALVAPGAKAPPERPAVAAAPGSLDTPPVSQALAAPPVHAAAGAGGADSAWDDALLDGVPAPAVSNEDIARMDWRALRSAIASCQRCTACRAGAPRVMGNGALQARWVVAAGATTAADEKERTPVAGDAGRLLANMLAAVELSRTDDVYVTNLIKCRPSAANGGDRAPTAAEAAACRPYLEREVALTGAATVLTLGQIAANALLDQPLNAPLAGARGTVHSVALGPARVALVATLHPAELLRRASDKAAAWADLCLARAAAPATADGAPDPQ